MIRKFIGLILLASPLAAQVDEAFSPEENAFSLEEAVDYALENSYTILDKQLEIQKAQKQIMESLALSLPSVTASTDLVYNAIIRPIAFPEEQAALFSGGAPLPGGYGFRYTNLGGGNWQPAATVASNLSLGYSNVLAKRAAEVLKETRRLDKEQSELTVSTDVAQAYYSALVMQENVQLLEDNLESLQKNLYETRQLFGEGFVEEQDVDQLELLVSNMQNNLNNTRRQEKLAKELLKFQMGMPLENSIALTSSLEERMEKVESELAAMPTEELKYENHVQYKLANSQYKGSVLNYKNEKADWYPTLSVGTSYTNFRVASEFDEVYVFDTYWAPAWTISGGLTWNFNFAIPAQAQQAKLEVRQAEVARKSAENQLKLRYKQARSEFLFALENYRTTRKNVDISRKIREKTRVKYSEGISSSLELTQAENQYLESQQQYVQAMLNLLQAKEELERAMGETVE